MGAYVYMLRCADGSFYIGSATGDGLSVRIDQHNAGYTFTRRPVVLVWSEHFDRITDAIAVERQLKRLEPSQEGGTDTVGLDEHRPIVSAPRGPHEAKLNGSSFEARKSSHLGMTAQDDGAHTACHRRTLSVAPSGVASKIGDAKTAWR
jgi:predicted GIY-YIG superfamily endonuclease